MAIVSLAITDVSTGSRILWHKVSATERQKIKTALAVEKLTNFHRFSFRFKGKNEIQEGYAHKTGLACRLSLVVIIKSSDRTFARYTMQRMSHSEPFIRLI